MRSSLFLTSTVLGLFPSCFEALAIRGQPDLRLGERGFVETGNFTTRQVAVAPEECWVQGLGQSSYWFVPVYAGKEIYACVMAHTRATGQSWNCPGEDWWPDSYVEEIITAGQEQITKDGGGETSESGVFEARFEGTTTAISDREGMSAVFDALFRYSLPNCDTNPGYCKTKARHYYYRYKGDAIGIVHKQSDCRGFLGIGGDVYSYCPGRGHCQD